MATTDSITLPIPEQPDSENWRDIDVSTPEGLRQLDLAIAERLGWVELSISHQNWERGWHTEYEVNRWHLWGRSPDMETGITLAPSWSTDANALLLLLREWYEDHDIDLHADTLDALGTDGVFEALLSGDYVRLCKAYCAHKDVRNTDAQARQQKGGA